MMVDLGIPNLHAVMPCGHEDGTVIKIDYGERVEGEDWRIVRTGWEVRCNICSERSRFSIESA